MFPSRNYHCYAQKHQGGSALVIAIFVILVMSLLAVTLLRVGGDADEGVNLEVWGLRALNAANSGADAALARLFPLSGGTAGCAAVGSSWTAPDVTGFHGCNVQLSCETLSQDTSRSVPSCIVSAARLYARAAVVVWARLMTVNV